MTFMDIEEQLADTAEELSNEWRDMSDLEMYKLKLSHNLATIEQRYNYNPNLPSFNDIYKLVKSKANERYKINKRRQIKKRIRNRWFRRDFIKTEYYRYLYGISQFILDVKIPDESFDRLCQFLMHKKFKAYNYRSYTYGKSDPAKYLQELIDEYKHLIKLMLMYISALFVPLKIIQRYLNPNVNCVIQSYHRVAVGDRLI